MTRKTLIEKNSRNGKKSFPMIMSDHKSINIDTFEDLEYARYLLRDEK